MVILKNMDKKSSNPENKKHTNENTAAVRNHFIDAYRGITMISMVLYHASYDYFIIFMKDYDWLLPPITFLWQQSICISFIIVSGMVWQFGKKHAFKRGLILIALGTVITFVTLIFMPGETIYYGILTFMGIATLFTILYDRLYHHVNSIPVNSKFGKNGSAPTELIYCLICLLLFALTKRFPNGYVGTRMHVLFHLPDGLYKYSALAPLGFPPSDFRSADYFPVIPWIFMYVFGYHLGNLLLNNNTFTKLGSRRIPILSWLGTKSLLVYIIHQPICYGIVWLICR